MQPQELVKEEPVSEQEAIEKIKKFLEKWSAISFKIDDSPGPLYTAGFEALASVIKAEAAQVLPALEALAGGKHDA